VWPSEAVEAVCEAVEAVCDSLRVASAVTWPGKKMEVRGPSGIPVKKSTPGCTGCLVEEPGLEPLAWWQ
jgi:hypothetical protein